MDNIIKLTTSFVPRRYALMSINNKTKLACFVNDEWIIDATCTSINEMLESGLVGEEAVTGWICNQQFICH